MEEDDAPSDTADLQLDRYNMQQAVASSCS